ncbi:MAG: sigma-70 family RNA polymerase sigma factor [Tenuifilum sp.]|uniref:RNA polymerase sigma factor n=1 Tax=Tenuifilum sp. TaxID=2760880 RepID=UPI001B77F103|nr:sigma-70 family RNA polymerase sigma factor [Bacteroidales bacterium]HOU75251.1 sigma-70 family RNA polymerase sigma factor [Tenuifilum sp.]
MNTTSRSDCELLSDFVAGNNSALELLYKRYERKVYTYILLMVRKPQLAEDILQETFIKAIKSVKEGKYSETNRFGSWLMRIAHNLVIDQFRQNKQYRVVSNNDFPMDIFSTPRFAEATVEQRLVYERVLYEVRALIDFLPDDQREVVMLRFYGDLSFKEIAEITNVSINTALGRMRYALINLRKMVKEKNLSLEFEMAW